MTALMAAVERELSSSRPIWEGRKLLDSRDQSDSQYWFLDEVLRDRADKSLEHVFSLLALHLPAEPLKVAFRALHSEDRMLRGLALEFLENHLSRAIVSQLAAAGQSGLVHRRAASRSRGAERVDGIQPQHRGRSQNCIRRCSRASRLLA